MFGPKELDTRNTYNPNLDDIQESARRTYGSANSLFEINELNLKNLEMQLESGKLSSKEDIYDKSHTAVSLLAECCEMYLKALFLYEHRNDGKTIKELWTVLEAKTKEDKNRKDRNGNIIYYQTEKDNETPLRHSDGTIVYVYVKVDSNGNAICDTDGKPIYVDKTGKEYDYMRKGNAVKTNGHALDRLVELLSPASRLLLETRMLTIPMGLTEKNASITILDLLQNRGLISSEEHISQDQFVGWLDQHKRAFEESRYPGQKKYDINVEFMYHLETQIKAIVQYKLDPKQNQNFTVTDEELSKLPPEIEQLASFHSYLISEDLIKLIANNDRIKNKIISIFSKEYSLPSSDISPSNFCKMVKLMSEEEITYISRLWYMVKYYDNFNEKNIDDKIFNTATMLKSFGITSKNIIEFFVQLKEIFGESISLENKNVEKLLRVLRNQIVHGESDIYNKEIKYNFNFENMDYVGNNKFKL